MEKKQIIIDIDKDPCFHLNEWTCDKSRIDEIRKLNEDTDVFLCTDFVDEKNPENSGKVCRDRFTFLLNTFPFIPPKRFIFTKAKNLLKLSSESDGESRERKIMLLDVDEVIWFSDFLGLINEFLRTSYKIDDFTDYYIDEVAIPKERFEDFKKFQRSRSLFKNAKLIPEAIQVSRKLSEVVDIYFYTDCIDPLDVKNSARNYEDKFARLREVMPFIPIDRYVFTGSKQILKGNIQIDDRLSNLDPDIPLRILFPSYHNKNYTEAELDSCGVIRAGNDWRVGWSLIEGIVNSYIETPKKSTKF